MLEVYLGMCLGRLNKIDSFGCNCTLGCSQFIGSQIFMVHRGFTSYQHSACLPHKVARVFTWMYCMFYVLITYRNTTPMYVEMCAGRKPLVGSSMKKENICAKTHKQSKSFDTTC